MRKIKSHVRKKQSINVQMKADSYVFSLFGPTYFDRAHCIQTFLLHECGSMAYSLSCIHFSYAKIKLKNDLHQLSAMSTSKYIFFGF